MEILIPTIDRIDEAAREFAAAMGESTVFALHGPMGAGKTTFVKALCAQLGVRDVACSPTFALLNEYETAQGTPVYHFDFYRIKTLAEAIDMGCLDYFSSGSLCLIEWPELVEDILPPDAVRVDITVQSDGSRRLTF
ncbi:MAG: tRNA (adenosine(37)-N6)-threonylcarbamoyltransferase complex ATPase subunit type 1 TsaE [Prevotellaceae bacterium]|nr:tRNA (adenosine(37)-N6)-threonylcarbamoyltransferase complex ATPase subunit type 1 TsaE [Prevotellaceae bacterium]